jgi:formylglycine-generating enzyme required for sulfatase activity
MKLAMKFRYLIVLSVALCAVLATRSWADTQMIRIPGGSFMMGSNSSLVDECPSHKVTVKTFYLNKTAVSNAQFVLYLNQHGHVGPNGERIFDLDDSDARIKLLVRRSYVPFKGHENMPVLEASWIEARHYCKTLGKRLPTEAEWEYAARGKEGRQYPWGNEAPDKTRAHYDHNWGDMAPVDAYPKGATPEGVLGMASNVHEWTTSETDPYPYRADDGREKVSYFANRVTRGGTHDSPADELIATWRGRIVLRNPNGGQS